MEVRALPVFSRASKMPRVISSAPVREITGPDPATWLDEHGDALYAFALLRVRDASLAEDLVQDSLLAGLRSLDRFRGESSERTWLIGILKHKIVDHLRGSGRTVNVEQDLAELEAEDAAYFDETGHWRGQIGEWADPERSLEREQFWQALHECIRRLPENLGTLFVLREVDGLDTGALMNALNISSENNVWVMLSRARQRLRRCLETSWFKL